MHRIVRYTVFRFSATPISRSMSKRDLKDCSSVDQPLCELLSRDGFFQMYSTRSSRKLENQSLRLILFFCSTLIPASVDLSKLLQQINAGIIKDYIMVRRTQNQIRTKLLAKLGIFPKKKRVTRVCTNEAATEKKLLSTMKARRRVSFNKKVSVVEIPSHRDYDDESHSSTWLSCGDIQSNAERNLREFAAEGWDWKNVVEETSMYRLTNGQLVHPATYYNLICNYAQSKAAYNYATSCRREAQNKQLAIRNLGLRPPSETHVVVLHGSIGFCR